MGVVVSEIHTGAGGEHKCLSWEELTCLKGDIAAIQKVKIVMGLIIGWFCMHSSSCPWIRTSSIIISSSLKRYLRHECSRLSWHSYVARCFFRHFVSSWDTWPPDSLAQDLVTIEALTAQEENAEADKLIGSLQNGSGGVVNTRMCYMCFDDVDEAGNPLVSATARLLLPFCEFALC